MITYNDIKSNILDTINLQKIEDQIDKSLIRFHGWYPWEQAIIEGEYSLEARNAISQKYIENGWNYVYHRTSSENGEPFGLTSFKFSSTELDPLYVRGYHKCNS